MAIKNIVFDLGGVLVDWNPKYLYEKIFASEEQVDHFLSNICTVQWNAQQDAGRTMQEATERLVKEFPGYEPEIRAYYHRWTEMFSGHIQGSLDILKELKERNHYRLLALTNWSGETFPTAKRLFPFLSWFEGIVVSGEERMIKPDHRLYKVLFDRYMVAPHDSLFIDDSLPNVFVARELGMTAIHFNDPEKLEDELVGLGLF
jgi:2-haloacid dehalogenase